MAEHEEGVGTTRISRRKAVKLGALGVAGGAAAWLLPGTASGGSNVAGAIPGICARGSGDVCGRRPRQCGISRSSDALCVCATNVNTPGVVCVEDRPDLGFDKCTTRFDCAQGQICVKRCVDVLQAGSPRKGPNQAQQFEFTMSICAWPCHYGPEQGEGED